MRFLRFLFTFEGRLSRGEYALGIACVLLAQYGAVGGFIIVAGGSPAGDWTAFLVPARFASIAETTLPSTILLAVLFLALWSMTALAARRAADSGLGGWLAALTIIPWVQLVTILVLGFARTRDFPRPGTEKDLQRAGTPWRAIFYGALIGAAVALFAVAVGALGFGSYGVGIFILAPFFIGMSCAFVVNAKGDIGVRSTLGTATLSTALAGVMLLLSALEGAVCILLLAPLALPIVWLGALAGRASAQLTARPMTHAFAAFVILPTAFSLEQAIPPHIEFDLVQTIEIDAAPATVWQTVVFMPPIAEPPLPLFRLGVAYPVAAELSGEGVDAIRRGVFSTGTAVERVTTWVPAREFAFEVLENPPALRELSPYETVHAPHVHGYFTTTHGSFVMEPLPGGSTRLVERTSHELRLDPLVYWLPIARWMIEQNNARILRHIKSTAETVARSDVRVPPR